MLRLAISPPAVSPFELSVIAATIFATSFVSGIFGMAGGMMLLGVLLLFLDVVPAMVLFGAIQLTANGWRAVLWRAHVGWSLVWRYLLGSLVAFLILRLVAFVPPKALVYLAMGLLPFLIAALPERARPDITRPGMPWICGAAIMLLQLTAGAAGHILDMCFHRSALSRQAVVGTKAVTQSAAHLLRIAYFGTFATAFSAEVPWWSLVAAPLIAVAGTSLAAGVIERMTDAGFRLWSRRIVFAVGAVYVVRGLWLVAT